MLGRCDVERRGCSIEWDRESDVISLDEGLHRDEGHSLRAVRVVPREAFDICPQRVGLEEKLYELLLGPASEPIGFLMNWISRDRPEGSPGAFRSSKETEFSSRPMINAPTRFQFLEISESFARSFCLVGLNGNPI